jgi:Family of unknown function (DUF5687)
VFKIFIYQSLKGFLRNTRFDLGLILKILIIISVLDICILIYLFGANFKEILHKLLPLEDPVKYFNDCLFYLMPVFCLLLFFLQKSNCTYIRSYLHLPINRGKIITYILVRNLFNLPNLCLILFICPFFWNNILPNSDLIPSILYLTGILSVLIFVTYFTNLLIILANDFKSFAILPVVWLILALILKYFSLAGPKNYLASLFSNILEKGYLSLLPILFLALVATIIYRSLVKQFIYNIYSNNSDAGFKNEIIHKRRITKIRNLYILLEINMILRNRRIISIVTIPIYITIITYAVFLFKPSTDNLTLFFLYLCLSGAWGYSYLQYAFSFEGGFFDFISSSGFDLKKFIKAKYVLIVLLSIWLVIIMLPVIIIRNQSIYVIGTSLLYNIGIGFNVVFLSATFNHERIDLSKSLFFNYQGYNTVQVISMGLAIFLPFGFLVITSLYFGELYGLAILNIISMISFLSSKKWVRLIYKTLLRRKYINLEGFRK